MFLNAGALRRDRGYRPRAESKRVARIHNPYGDGRASERIRQAIEAYFRLEAIRYTAAGVWPAAGRNL
jgi:hypothetical protein